MYIQWCLYFNHITYQQGDVLQSGREVRISSMNSVDPILLQRGRPGVIKMYFGKQKMTTQIISIPVTIWRDNPVKGCDVSVTVSSNLRPLFSCLIHVETGAAFFFCLNTRRCDPFKAEDLMGQLAVLSHSSGEGKAATLPGKKLVTLHNGSMQRRRADERRSKRYPDEFSRKQAEASVRYSVFISRAKACFPRVQKAVVSSSTDSIPTCVASLSLFLFLPLNQPCHHLKMSCRIGIISPKT